MLKKKPAIGKAKPAVAKRVAVKSKPAPKPLAKGKPQSKPAAKASVKLKPAVKKAGPKTKVTKAKTSAKPKAQGVQTKPKTGEKQFLVPKAAVQRPEAELRAIAIAEAAFDKKALDVVVLDMGGFSPIVDYMVVASARSETHLRAVAENVEDQMIKQKQKPSHREGYREGRWIVLDYGDILVNLFLDRQRGFYGLEKLWSKARVVVRYTE
jgi:ribosome-associated protein